MKRILLLIAAVFALAVLPFSCEKPLPDTPEVPDVVDPDTEEPDKPDLPDPQPEPQPEVKEKPVMLWIDASANFSRLRYKREIKRFLDIAQEAGFNGFCLDVKPIQGHALYKSGFLKPCTSMHGVTVERDWDYLQCFLDEAKERKMRVTVSAAMMTWGATDTKLGPAFEDPALKDAAAIEYLPEPIGLRPTTETTDRDVFCFMNPHHPEVRKYIRNMVTELVTNYDFDSFILDYCRFQNMNSDFSDLSRQEFEKYTGRIVQNWPKDIYYFKPGAAKGDFTPGPRYNEWVEYRSWVIQQLVTEISDLIHELKPEMQVELWGAPWWPLFTTGQNWASARTDRTSGYWCATPDYYKTGFADKLDIFQVGAYGSTLEGIANDVFKAKTITDGDCTVFGSISAANGAKFDMAGACEYCLKETEGLMVFELSHILTYDFWDEIKEGVARGQAASAGK